MVVKKIISTLSLILFATILNSSVYAYSSDHVKTNVLDAAVFTVVATVINDYVVQNQQLSVPESLMYGVGGWLCGELLETIYKTVYKEITDKNLRDVLGSTKICSDIEMDNHHALRRVITLIPLYVALYLHGNSGPGGWWCPS